MAEAMGDGFMKKWFLCGVGAAVLMGLLFCGCMREKGSYTSDEGEAHVLSEQELDALWEELDGIWCINESEGIELYSGWDNSRILQTLVGFSRLQNGQCVLQTAVPETEWRAFYIDMVAEQDGVYTFSPSETWGTMLRSTFEPGAGNTFTLRVNEDGGITLSASAPARYGESATSRTDEGDEVGGWHWRLATAEEKRAAQNSSPLDLENGDIIEAAHTESLRRFRRETPEEERERMGG